MTWTRRATEYRTQVGMAPVERDGVRVPDAYHLWSTPYPIHQGTLNRAGEMWVIRMPTVWLFKPLRFFTIEEARFALASMISRRAGAELQTFGPTQRVAMGQQRCPKVLGGVMCGQTATGYSIWCEWHPAGRVMKDA